MSQILARAESVIVHADKILDATVDPGVESVDNKPELADKQKVYLFIPVGWLWAKLCVMTFFTSVTL